MRIVVALMTIMMMSAMHDAGAQEVKLNHLVGEKSPYLIQHVTNPVDWYPWGEAAFAKAKKENKPILLSIGYSTCHWCHVMERESFTNQEVADYLNKHFVSIKVDREERPDVDKVYMTAYQAMYQGGGGWPLNMFLTPELKPFAGGTYFPPVGREGRPSFLDVLQTLTKAWSSQGGEVVKSANQIHTAMSKELELKKEATGKVGMRDVENAAGSLLSGADTTHGGWGAGPKFPQVSHLRFLLRQWHRAKDTKALELVLLTCDKMMQGGIHDHLAGGFHRYAVDGEWLVPHFEKMLYDQAQLLDLYLDVWLISGDIRYRDVAMGIANFVLREMQHQEGGKGGVGGKLGGFFCALDAQSEGKEGKFVCWTQAELKSLLTEDEFKLISRLYGITEEGNFIDHSDPHPLPKQNILHIADPEWEPSEKEQVTLGLALIKMKEVRAKRIPAATDDKVLADWNGMMIASMARAGKVLGKPKYSTSAIQAHAFIKEKLWDGKVLYHRWRDGERDQSQQASSYLQMIAGSLGLYQTTLDPAYLNFSIQLAEGARALFYDEKHGGFFLGTKRPDLVLRLKDDFDGAVATASSVAAMQYHILAEITGRKDFREVVDKTLAANAQIVKGSPYAMSGMLSVADSTLGKHARLVIAGEKGADAMISARYHQYAPRLILMGNRGKVDEFTRGLKPIDGKAAAYYCEGETCQPPVTDVMALEGMLKLQR